MKTIGKSQITSQLCCPKQDDFSFYKNAESYLLLILKMKDKTGNENNSVYCYLSSVNKKMIDSIEPPPKTRTMINDLKLPRFYNLLAYIN